MQLRTVSYCSQCSVAPKVSVFICQLIQIADITRGTVLDTRRAFV
jgi:hypothetical protein